MKNKFLTVILMLNALLASAQNPVEMPLYEGNIPNNKPDIEHKDKIVLENGGFRISEVSKPTMTRFNPTKPNGMSVIICPGGGYGRLAFDHEGVEVAKNLNALGVTAFVLKYRLPNEKTQVDRSIAPLQDAQQAIRLVRKNAEKWGLNAQKVGIMGFSAGGHLAATAAVAAELAPPLSNTTQQNTTSNGKAEQAPPLPSVSVRPDFAILIYPVISFVEEITHKGSRNNLIGDKPTPEKTQLYSNELQVTAQTPPSFLVHAADDGAVPVENSLRFYQACVKNKVPIEMHLYPKGGHGFGLNNKTTEDKWFERLGNWLKAL